MRVMRGSHKFVSHKFLSHHALQQCMKRRKIYQEAQFDEFA